MTGKIYGTLEKTEGNQDEKLGVAFPKCLGKSKRKTSVENRNMENRNMESELTWKSARYLSNFQILRSACWVGRVVGL